MQGPQINLKWKSFQSNILSSFENIWEEESLVDVTLASDGKCLKAHKIMLSASSPFFKKIFQMNPCQHPVIVLQDVHYEELESILKFVYKGEVSILQENLPLLLRAAETLRIRGLCQDLESGAEDVENSRHEEIRKKIVCEKLQSTKSPPDSPKNTKKLKGHHNYKSDTPSPTRVSPTIELTVPVYPFVVEDVKHEPRTESPVLSPVLSADKFNVPLGSADSCQTGIIDSDEDEPDLSVNTNECAFDLDQASSNFPFPPFPCPFCDRAYTRWGFRRRHIKACHTRSQSLPCKWCLEVLPTHTDWESHVCLKHSLSRNDARKGLLILEEAEVVLQIPQPSRLDALVTMIKEQSNKSSDDRSKILEINSEHNDNVSKEAEQQKVCTTNW